MVVEGVLQGCGLNLSVLGLASWPEVGLGMAAELREPSSPPQDLPVAWVTGGALQGATSLAPHGQHSPSYNWFAAS